ncbi:MAG: hypothetical protein A3K75_05115 [Euryarchaeota archaeon RBG_13_61_15]|nr:MAG: hypothetical protein A3K75_05115 [Euryarchaeota archaeon RBG_13_61_15]
MPARALETVRIDYPKHWFVLGTVVLSAVIAFGAYSAYCAIEDFTRYFWAGACVLTGLMLSLFFVPPLFTHHLAGEKGLKVHMGLLINETVPYAWISDIKDTYVKRGGMTVGVGVRYFGIMRTVFVTSSFRDLVTIKFGSAHVLGKLLKKDVEQIVLSVKDKGTLTRMLRERTGLGED